jgi:AIPR protein
MNKSTMGKPALPVVIPFHCIRNISSPEDQAEKRFIYSGQLPISSLEDLPTNENVREYLVDAEGKQRRSPTQVHLAIRETLKERSSAFSVLNGGVVIVAKSSEIDEKVRTLTLRGASIINGSQTQGEVRTFLSSGGDGSIIHVKFELIITDDEDLVADISISRNFQNDVKLLSIAGRKGELDELE